MFFFEINSNIEVLPNGLGDQINQVGLNRFMFKKFVIKDRPTKKKEEKNQGNAQNSTHKDSSIKLFFFIFLR